MDRKLPPPKSTKPLIGSLAAAGEVDLRIYLNHGNQKALAAAKSVRNFSKLFKLPRLCVRAPFTGAVHCQLPFG